MNVCEKCGGKTRKADLFCASCGAKLKVEKPGGSTKKKMTPPQKKEKVELSAAVKKRLKAELEVSIRAFKDGKITLEEFQNIKKGIVSKARAGFYNQGSDQTSVEPPQSPPAEGVISSEVSRTQKADKPIKSGVAPPFSRLWYLAPVIFNIFGGLVAYFAIKNLDVKSANRMLIIGGIGLIAVLSGTGYYLYSENLLPPDNAEESPAQIIIDGSLPVEDTPVIDAGGVVPVLAANNSAEKMNLQLKDMESGFYINRLLSGNLVDPLEFVGGNSTKAGELSAQGWLENHRIVIKKDFVDTSGNTTITEKEIDSSISKYDANKTSRRYFEGLLKKHRNDLSADGYTLVDFEINDSGVMGKKVEADPEFDLRVSYRVFFYKQNAFVGISISKIGRGLDEAEVREYAKLIESRVK